jgi:hypothetical protein
MSAPICRSTSGGAALGLAVEATVPLVTSSGLDNKRPWINRGKPLKYVRVSGVSRMPDGKPVSILDIRDTH